MANGINLIMMLLFLVCWIVFAVKCIVNRRAAVTTVQAEVVDKYKPEIVSQHPGTFQPERFIVVFATKGKKLSFAVSEFSYHNYKINEKGTLKYKGTKLISFQ